MLLGLGAVAVVGYLVYQQMNKNPETTASTGTIDNTSANFVNLTSRRKRKKRRSGTIYGNTGSGYPNPGNNQSGFPSNDTYTYGSAGYHTIEY